MPNDLQLEVTSTTPDLELALTDYVGSAYSPQVEVEDIDGGHNVSITHKGPDGLVTDSFDVMDGVDGVSPTVDITSTTERHTITITDAQGPHVYQVDTYADDELARVTAENGRASAESARVAAESARADAETGRSTAESARDEAESVRSAEEVARAENETTRVTNETVRANAEIARNAAEQAREQAETSREAAWVTLSEQATSATQSANNAAQTASQAASAANSAAQSASQAESTMTANETARASAEQGRVAAEQGRVTAEQARVSAETARATEWAEIESDAQSAVEAAESATQNATDAAALATRAAANLWNAGNVLFGELAEGTVLTADDAFAAPPKSVEVYGKSTQAGTPTPDAPVFIESVDELALTFAGKNLLDNDGYFPKTLEIGTYYSDFCVSYTNSQIPKLKLLAGVTYTLSMNVTSDIQPFSLSAGAGNGTYQADIATAINLRNGRVSVTFTPTQANFSYGNIFAFRVPRFNTPQASGNMFTISDVQLEVSASATDYAPYVGQSVTIPLSNHVVRSLPDGTRDTLTLSYIGPSTEHEGWGVFGASLVQYAGDFLATSPNGWVKSTSAINGYYKNVGQITDGRGKSFVGSGIMSPWFKAANNLNEYFQTINSCWVDSAINFNIDPDVFSGTAAEFGQWVAEHNIEFYMPLDTPVTTTLDPIELPILPNPLTAWADGGSAAPTLSMVYEQDINIVIGRLRDAIADMATS